MDSLSDCTYDRYARDITASQDYLEWKPFHLSPEISMSLLHFDRVVHKISDLYDDSHHQGMTVVDGMLVYEYTFEPLIPVPIPCWSTAQSLTYSRPNDVVMCMSNNSARNLIFGLR
jgi:hypothetical protein